MKIEVNEFKNRQDNFKYPCLLKSTDNDLVILAPEEGRDAIVVQGNMHWVAGQHYGQFDPGSFRVFKGTVTISSD